MQTEDLHTALMETKFCAACEHQHILMTSQKKTFSVHQEFRDLMISS